MSPQTLTWPLEVPPFSIEHQVRLSLEARIDWPALAGSNPWIIVSVNGHTVSRGDLLNKTDSFHLRDGTDLAWFDNGQWRIIYAPDFSLALTDKETRYGADEANHPYRFVWDITRYVKPGANELRIEHLQMLPQPDKLVLRNVTVEVGNFIQPPDTGGVAPAPTGPLATITAARPPLTPLSARAQDGTITVRCGSRNFRVRTRMSLPGGKWREAAATGAPGWVAGPCRVSRQVTVREDHIKVADTLTNLSDQLIGVRIEHRAELREPAEAFYLTGHKSFAPSSSVWEAAHPSAFAQMKAMGLGLVAEDDVFRVHVRSFHSPADVGLADDQLGLPPRSSVTLEWSIYPQLGGDYWSFVNAVRRNWDVNFTIPGAFVFATGMPRGLTGEQYAKWMRDRGLKYISGDIAKYPDGTYAHGTGITFAPEFVAAERDWTTKMAAADPELVPFAYFHAQCCTEPDNRTKYADARLLDDQGRQIDYPHAFEIPIYVPTENNSYGRALWRYVDTLINGIGAKGIYWDEMSYSVRTFAPCGPGGLPWDGHTVILNLATHEVTGKLSSVPLIMQSLSEKIVDHIQGQGLLFMGNSQAHTRTMMRRKLVRFVESGSYSRVLGAHLGCPLALGNHASNREATHAESAQNVRELLQRGVLYYGHYYSRDPAPWNYTDVMFPITPERIGPGYVLGKERIHTAVSGRFGFPDGAAAEVYVVDAQGARVTSGMVSEVTENGRRLYELRLPGDHFAILVRR